jgi:hypothetical protein
MAPLPGLSHRRQGAREIEHAHWLDQIRVKSGFAGGLAITTLSNRCDHDQPDPLAVGRSADQATELDPRLVREMQVNEQDLLALTGYAGESLSAVMTAINLAVPGDQLLAVDAPDD